jgi:triosephosphate isomerase
MPLIAGNWKMNGSLAGSRALVEALVRDVPVDPGADMLLCPPFVYLAAVAEWTAGSPIALGAQNLSEHGGYGAYTGEVAGAMLIDLGCRYVIVGHSERRALYGETDAVVAAKFRTAQAAGLVPILCVGETLAEREEGRTEAVITRQVGAVIAAAGHEAFRNAVVAYEPVWAIGTGRTATPDQAEEVHALIKRCVDVPVLYGGSVKPENADELLSQPDVDGALVGGASLDVGSFAAICEAASRS